MSPVTTSNIAGTRWAIRIIPFFLAGAFGFATYAVVSHLCVNYLYRKKGKKGLAVALLVLYFLFFALTIAAYLRTFLTAQFNTGFVPFEDERLAAEDNKRKKRRRKPKTVDIESQPWVNVPDLNPDSPGLEAFYSKEIFVCEVDGRPKWCPDCRAWKPDRAHHSSELNRCVRKMDHLCPWVGGMISENSFNFFAQFTFHCTIYCAICLATAAYCLRLQQHDGDSLDARIVVGIVLAALFGFFTSIMTMTTARLILTNQTSIDLLKKNSTYRLAVLVPATPEAEEKYSTVTYPLPPPRQKSSQSSNNSITTANALSTRDEQAKRRFAILETDAGENPWDLGYWKNWKSVMGDSVIDWFLPIRHSPCCNHESMVSDYEFGSLVAELRMKYGVPRYSAPQGRRMGY